MQIPLGVWWPLRSQPYAGKMEAFCWECDVEGILVRHETEVRRPPPAPSCTSSSWSHLMLWGKIHTKYFNTMLLYSMLKCVYIIHHSWWKLIFLLIKHLTVIFAWLVRWKSSLKPLHAILAEHHCIKSCRCRSRALVKLHRGKNKCISVTLGWLLVPDGLV